MSKYLNDYFIEDNKAQRVNYIARLPINHRKVYCPKPKVRDQEFNNCFLMILKHPTSTRVLSNLMKLRFAKASGLLKHSKHNTNTFPMADTPSEEESGQSDEEEKTEE